jgi:hypothetical protein
MLPCPLVFRVGRGLCSIGGRGPGGISPQIAGRSCDTRRRRSLVGGRGVAKVGRALALKNMRSFSVEEDIILEGYF